MAQIASSIASDEAEDGLGEGWRLLAGIRFEQGEGVIWERKLYVVTIDTTCKMHP